MIAAFLNSLSIQVLISFLGIIFVVVGLLMTRRHFRLLKTFHFIERYNSTDIAEKQFAVRVFLNKFNKAKDKESFVEEFLKSEKIEIINERISVYKFLNLLQEVSAAYKMGILDKKAFFLTFGSILSRNYADFNELVDVNRIVIGDKTIYKTFEEIAKRIDDEYNYNFIEKQKNTKK